MDKLRLLSVSSNGSTWVKQRQAPPGSAPPHALSVSSNGSTWVKLHLLALRIDFSDLSVSSNGSTWVKPNLSASVCACAS